jgi:hypothetical protein
VEEKYKIPTFWKPVQNEKGIIYADLYPQTIEHFFNVTKSAQRHAPYRLQFPVDYHHSILVNFPEEWNIDPIEEVIESDFY